MYRFDVYVNGEWVCSIEPEGSYKQGYYAARRWARGDRYIMNASRAWVVCNGEIIYSVGK